MKMNDNDAITILIVEDELNLRELWARVVAPLANVRCATSVREALALIDQSDIMLLDWMLGGESAQPVLDEWMARRGGPCCVVTGALHNPLLMDLYALGVYHAILKPISIDALTSILRRYVHHVRQARLEVQLTGEIKRMMREINRLRNYVFIMAVALAAVIGPNVFQYLSKLLV